MSWRFAKI